ncbi:MAG TPA: endolytic transglycosylase MltG [Patescibacteria group bacterium]|nr:endolytic transglycosylase MltG [Patescibacteria group bacterium]
MKKKLGIAFLSLVFIFVVSICAGIWWAFGPLSVRDQGKQQFRIAKGDTFSEIAFNLQSKGFVRTQWSMRFLGLSDQKVGSIQPGTYTLSSSMSPRQILDVLHQEAQDSWVTLLEGWRSEEMAQEIAAHLHPTFASDEFIALAKSREGMLFPDTYLIPKDATAQSVVSLLSNTFEKRYQKLADQYGQGKLSKQNTLTLASIVAHEASTPEDMQMVAGVLMNRLNAGIPLQSDVTLQYVKGYSPTLKTWWQEPKAEDKFIDSPYNTYMHKGLPPAPICNPGADAIAAVLNPTKSDYIYYLADKEGIVHFAKTLEQHNANIEKYLR